MAAPALRFAAELQLAPQESTRIGRVRQVVGTVPKSWARYAVHVIDPVVSLLEPGKVLRTEEVSVGAHVDLKVWWESGCIGVEIEGDGGREGWWSFWGGQISR